MQAEKPHM